ncbi:MAG: GNAT family N-acetyltransferase [Candidatus Pacearchaeota archaeon]|nr:GNAT family N-acetyltransferase [Candidatus Pacearchaeota archaeon]
MELTLATQEDFEQFLPIKEEFFREYNISKKSEKFILEEFKEYLLKGAIVLAIENREIIGYLAGEIEDTPYEKFGYISEVFVKKEYRGKGVSTKLKDIFLEFLRKKGITICRIEVNPDNPAQEVYKKWGFKIDKYRMSIKF